MTARSTYCEVRTSLPILIVCMIDIGKIDSVGAGENDAVGIKKNNATSVGWMLYRSGREWGVTNGRTAVVVRS